MNIYDIAKKANVSIATVSRVLNNPTAVKDETREKVEGIIKKYDYRPSDIARGLATNKTNTVGIMVPDIRNAFHAKAAYAVEQDLISRGYNSVLCNTSEEPSQKLKYFELLNQKDVDGIILIGAAYDNKTLEDAFEELNKKIAIVAINNHIGENSTFVICDEKYGIDQSIRHLKERGYKHPIYIQDEQKYITRACISKKDGFKRALKKYYPNQEIESSIICIKEDIKAYEKVIELLRKDKSIDAIQFEKDTCAIKFLKLVQNNGIDTPEELGIVGFDNIDTTNFTYKAISTIDHKIEELCSLGTKLLIDKINGKKVKNENYILPEFIKKETT